MTRTWGPFRAAAAVMAALATAVAMPAATDTPDVEGLARVIDGDTLEIAAVRIRLFGIDAPEASQRCGGGAGAEWDCGRVAADRLAALAAGAPVRCAARDRDRYGRVVATCTAGGLDLGGRLVAEGLAWAYVRYSEDYVADEADARRRGLGLWHGAAEAPWEFRAAAGDAAWAPAAGRAAPPAAALPPAAGAAAPPDAGLGAAAEPAGFAAEPASTSRASPADTVASARAPADAATPTGAAPEAAPHGAASDAVGSGGAPADAATAAAPPGCLVKGNVASGGARIYHLPGEASYARTRIDPRRGEAWFCDEASARAAGFRPRRPR